MINAEDLAYTISRSLGVNMTRPFDENTRVKIPATLQFLRLGYNYQSLQDSDIDFDTKIFVNRFKPAIEKSNSKQFCG